MTTAHYASVALSVVLALRPGCGPYKPEKPKNDELQELPEECIKESDSCYVGCLDRKEGQPCGTCCFEQRMLCNSKQPYDFKKCTAISPQP